MVLKNKYYKGIIYYLILGLFSQCNFYLPSYEEPKPKSFSYYGMFDKAEVSSELKMNSVYAAIDSNDYFYHKINNNDSCKKYYCKAFIFYDDGLVIYYSTFVSNIDEIKRLKKTTQGNVFGYYTVADNVLVFSTKSYYNKTEGFYTAKTHSKYILVDMKKFNPFTGSYKYSEGNVFNLY